ncbi:MAG: trmD [Propionibacteriaceae bacterium]|jgi:tRNA (guanine37-N1)-methyltransferase|nr:trmD [Propionibacteriaceae bacterium]
MRLDVVSIFPEYLAPLQLSLVGKAIENGLVDLAVHDLRQWTSDRHRTVDDTPYGGGAGMVMKPDPWGLMLDEIAPAEQQPRPAEQQPRLIVLTPSGRQFNQRLADELATEQHLIFACGRYEGIDARVVEHAATRMRVDEISIGDYVLNGGEAAALVIIEAIVRLIPGVVGNPESLAEESHSAGHEGLLEYPVYTKPPSWRDLAVPEVLFSGHHGRIAAWRREQALAKTRDRRPDLLPPVHGELVVGPATAADAGELFTLQQAAFMAEGRLNGSFDIPPLTQTLDELRDSLSQESGLAARGHQSVLAARGHQSVLAARLAGRLVGSVRGRLEADGAWYIGRLMVAPDLHGVGIGGRLMDAIEALAPEDATEYRLVTGALSSGSRRFYARRGYREASRGVDPAGVAILTLTKRLQ